MSALVEIRNLKKYFKIKRPMITKFFQKEEKFVHAVDGVTLDIGKEETFSLVGESGCGKTTCGKVILRLYPPTSGTVRFRGQDIFSLCNKEMKKLRSKMQMVFQNTTASLNPRKSLRNIISRPLLLNDVCDRRDVEDHVFRLMEAVGLSPPEQYVDRYPRELSGGERQRICIARALVPNPTFLILDEPTSALDVSIRTNILKLLEDLKRKMHLTSLFITHDLAVVRSISDKVAVMYLGQIVELAEVTELFSDPMHPYTQALLSATPLPNPRKTRNKKRIILEGSVPSPIDPPSGCRFHTRCPYCSSNCSKVEPELVKVAIGHHVACLNFT